MDESNRFIYLAAAAQRRSGCYRMRLKKEKGTSSENAKAQNVRHKCPNFNQLNIADEKHENLTDESWCPLRIFLFYPAEFKRPTVTCSDWLNVFKFFLGTFGPLGMY